MRDFWTSVLVGGAAGGFMFLYGAVWYVIGHIRGVESVLTERRMEERNENKVFGYRHR